ncbi:hypothetical protein HDA32_002629 [Spinactinospora alkalitolerans]|uniref:Septum formation-related domain-containing protein n=1 Tax=Spinactinospora alkalitolerans TaxID=687207 RepID=A0A852TU02_9ACTN|nr:hypothetical protein [Spinactinospora alkalitolerans]NYE47509.1 hypothetical protein [Spinactinospora alkalitolerans]
MPPIRSSRIPSVLVCAAAALTLSGCAVPVSPGFLDDRPTAQEEEWGDPSDMDTSGLEHGKIPSREPELDEADLPVADPPSDAPLTERIAWEALRDVSAFARAADPDSESECIDTTSELDGDSISLDCTVTYRGKEFDYNYGQRPDGTAPEPVYTAPLLRSVVENDLRFSQDTDYVNCDMEEMEAVPTSAASEAPGYRCVYLNPNTGDQERVEARAYGNGSLSFRPEE